MNNLVLALTVGVLLQADSLSHQVIPGPTGANGYEEYLQAADIVHGRAFKDFKRWEKSLAKSPGSLTPPQGLSAASSPLARKRYEVQTFGSALKLIAAGNLKPTSRGSAVMFVEGIELTDIAKLGVDAAYLSYAKGDWTAGANQLLELLTFGDNVSREFTMGQLMGLNILDKSFTAFDSHKSQWSVSDCDRIAVKVTDLLAKTPSLVTAVWNEQGLVTVNAYALLGKKSWTAEDYTGSDLSAELGKRLKAASPSEREQISALVQARIAKAFEEYNNRMRKPEAEWLSTPFTQFEPPLTVPLKSVSEIARAILQDALPSEETMVLAMRSRAQFRLLRLHALIQSFKWQHGRLPRLITEAASAAEIFDPLTGEAFHYQPMPSGYKLYSKGVSPTGEIELAYHKPRELSSKETTPP